jgi:prepilin-type N-terminal cleavage/methylation domain-containing protein
MQQARTDGYTLIEVIVVLVILTIAAAIVAPSLLVPHRNESSSLTAVIAQVHIAAVRRAEMVRLRIDRSGAWQATAHLSGSPELLMSGQLPDGSGGTDLLFSPLGTCAPSAETGTPPAFVSFDPLTCEARLQ